MMINAPSQFDQIERAVDEASSPSLRSSGSEVTLIDVITQLALRKSLIAKVTGIAFAVALIACFVLPVKYTAVTKIMPPQQTQSAAAMMMSQLVGSNTSALAAMAGSGLGLKNPDDLYVGLLTSRPIADNLIQKFELEKLYRSKDMTAARKTLANATEVTSEKSGLISISVTDKDKRRAAEMANAYTEELRNLTKNVALSEASERRLFFEDELKQTRESLVNAELNFENVEKKKGLVQLDAQAKAMIESLSAVRAQIAAKQVQIQALRSYSTEHNPDLELAERELSSLKDEAARLAESNHSSESNRSSDFADLGLQDVPGAGIEYLRAENELRYQQALYDLLLKQYDAARLDEAKEPVIVQVVEPAIVPDRKSSPKRLLILLGATFAGLFAGSILALFQRWLEVLRADAEGGTKLNNLRTAMRIRSRT